MKQDMRAEFETVYCKTGENIDLSKMPNNPDQYRSMVAHYAWHAWQNRQQELDAARLEVDRLRGLIGLSYGYLWHVNNEHGTPQRFYPPERAAYEARKLLRDTLTHEQRGQYINSVRELIDEALAAQQEKMI